MKKSIYIFSYALLLILFGCVFNQAWSDDMLTRDQAIAILIDQVISPIAYEDYYMAFGPQQMLTAGDKVEPEIIGSQPYPGSTKNIQEPTWFFWVDTDKWARFSHLVYFVYIDASHPNPTVGDGILVSEQGWWPNINDVDYLKKPADRWVSSDIVYGEAPTGPPTAPPPE